LSRFGNSVTKIHTIGAKRIQRRQQLGFLFSLGIGKQRLRYGMGKEIDLWLEKDQNVPSVNGSREYLPRRHWPILLAKI